VFLPAKLGENSGSLFSNCSRLISKRRKRRSPASPASENGANRELKYNKRKSTSARPDAQGPERHFYWIADGQTNAGFVEQIGESYNALAADERALGTFANLTAAADAVSAAYEAAR
jgi:hypothetical protein